MAQKEKSRSDDCIVFSTSSGHEIQFESILDSAASEHIATTETLSNLPTTVSPLRATVANGISVPAIGMTAPVDEFSNPMRWHGLSGCPNDLTSLPKLCDQGYTFVLSPSGSRSIAILPDTRAFVIPRSSRRADGTRMWRMSYKVDRNTNSIKHDIPFGSMLPRGTTASRFLAEEERRRYDQCRSVDAFICPISSTDAFIDDDDDLLPYSASFEDTQPQIPTAVPGLEAGRPDIAKSKANRYPLQKRLNLYATLGFPSERVWKATSNHTIGITGPYPQRADALFHRLAGSCPTLPVPSIIPHHDSMSLPIGVCWCMDFIPTPTCYQYDVILLFKEKRTAYLRPDRLKSSTYWYDAVVRLKSFVKDSRGVDLRLLFADCGSEWTNTHVGGNGTPASAKAKKLLHIF